MNDLIFLALIKRLVDLNGLVDSLPGSVYWKDLRGHYLGRNAAAKESMVAYGYDDKEVVGLTDYDFFPEEQAEQFRQHDQHTVETGKENVVEEVLMTPDGSIHVHYSMKRPLVVNDEIVGVVGSSFNITHLKEIEHELENLKQQAKSSEYAKNIFFQNIEHDLRTPNSIIEMATAELLKTEDDPARIDMLDNIRYCSNQMRGHINHLIDYSRLGEMVVKDKARINLHALLKRVVNVSRLKNTNNQLTFTLAIDRSLPAFLDVSAYALSRILLNVMDNSMKFTVRGEISLKAWQIIEQGKTYNYIEVQDTGSGIASSELDHVFDLYYTSNDRVDRPEMGKGLGLGIVKQLVELIGGDIELENREGYGLTFRIKLPVDEQDSFPVYNDEKLQSDDDKCKKMLRLSSLRVLLVEDNVICAQMAEKLLVGAGCQVQWVASGDAAIMMLKTQSFDLILTDLNLPDIDGFDLASEIRGLTKSLEGGQLIFALSANSSESYSYKKNTQCIDAFLVKPLSLDALSNQLLACYG